MFSCLLSIFEPMQPDCHAPTANHQTQASRVFSPEEHILTPSFSTPRKLSSSPESPFIHSFIQRLFCCFNFPIPSPPPPMTFPFPQTLLAGNTRVTNSSDPRAQAQIRNSGRIQARWQFWGPGQESQSMSRGHVSVCLSGQSVLLSLLIQPVVSMQKSETTKSLLFFFFLKKSQKLKCYVNFTNLSNFS